MEYLADSSTAVIDHSLSHQLNLGMIVTDRFGALLEANETARQILGLDDNIYGSSIYDLHTIFSDQFRSEIDKLLNGHQEIIKKDHVIKNFKGEIRNINFIGRNTCENETGNHYFYLNENSPTSRTRRRCLDVVSQVAQAISSSFSNEKILNVLLSGATAEQGLGLNRAYLFLYDEKNDTLNGHLAVGPSDQNEADSIWRSLQDKSESLDALFTDNPEHFINYNRAINEMIRTVSISLEKDSLISEISRKKEAVILYSHKVNCDLLKKLNAREVVLAPMISNNRLIGLIAADNEINHQPLEDQVCYILQILANQAAVALERSSLYTQITAKAEELQDAYQKLTESQEQIIKVEKMSVIGELTASIAHELKNPMAIVGGFAHLLLKNKDKSDHDEYLKIITQEIKRAEEVLAHVLEFSKTSQEEKNDFHFEELIGDVLNQLQSRMNLSRLELVNNISAERITINGNYAQLKYAFYQILKLMIGDIIMPAKVIIQLNRQEPFAALDLIVEPEEENRSYTRKNLSKTFLGNKLSQRLPILVADEALRFHGGYFKFNNNEDQPIQLMIQLPVKEVSDEK